MKEVTVNGANLAALVDSGCTRTLVHESVCRRWRGGAVRVVTVSGEQLECAGTSDVSIAVSSCAVEVSALVVRERPLGFGVILGMDAIQALGGVTVRSPCEVRFACEETSCTVAGVAAEDSQTELKVEKDDFVVTFDPVLRRWTVSWKWSGSPPSALGGAVHEYPVPAEARAEYETELDNWIRDGWLCEYDERELGPPKGSIPLMAVVQRSKVRPVLDFRSLNRHVTAFTADADVCSERLRKWRRMGTSVALLDLKKAFLQIHVDKSLWPYQTVWYRGKRLALTRLGFGLSLASSILQTVLDAAVAQDPRVAAAVSTYVDDILVDETKLSASEVAEHLRVYGLETKPPQRARDGARILGLRVRGEPSGHLTWRRDNEVKRATEPMTRRKAFSICGQLISHHPVCGWLRPAASFVKRLASEVTNGWDDPVGDSRVVQLVNELLTRVESDDPARGRWDVSGGAVTVWTDASSLALGAVLEVDGETVEDASWLRRTDDDAHINLSELDAVLKGVNLALQWQAVDIDIVTDSRTVLQWVTDALSGKSRLRSKAASEMLIRRRLSTLKSLADEYDLNMRVRCVPSAANKADILTRVPKEWMRTRDAAHATAAASLAAGAHDRDSDGDPAGTRDRDSDGSPAGTRDRGGAGDPAGTRDRGGAGDPAGTRDEESAGGPAGAQCVADEYHAGAGDGVMDGDLGAGQPGAAAAAESEEPARARVRDIHHTAGHPGVRRTFFFARQVIPGVTKGFVREVVAECELCRSIDPAPVKWRRGELSTPTVWGRVAIDVTHVRGRAFLTLIDCGPSRFTIWRPLRLQTSAVIAEQLESVFMERGAPEELLADNDPAFRSRRFSALMNRWGIRIRFRAAHVPSGNGIIERCHRSIKVIAARTGCTVAEAVYRYNVSPRDDETAESAPANLLYRYEVRVRGMDGREDEAQRPWEGQRASSETAAVRDPYRPGDSVWVRPPRARCDTQYGKGRVTRVISDQCVEVDGMPRHVKELRHRAPSECASETSDDDDEPLFVWPQTVGDADDPPAGHEDEPPPGSPEPRPRRSERVPKPNPRYGDCCALPQ